MYLLDWTGNHFLDPAHVRKAVSRLAATDWDPTRRGDRKASALVEAIAGFFEIEPGWIAVVPGSAAGIDAFLRSHPTVPIVDITPNFHQTRTVAHRDRRDYVAVPLAPGTDLRAVLAPYRGQGAILVLASPSNPYGFQVPIAVLEGLLLDWDGPLLVDEAYADFAPATALRLVAGHPNLCVSRTFSKAWGLADLRIGFLAGRAIADTFTNEFLSCLSPGRVAIEAACHLLANPWPIQSSVHATLEMRAIMARQLRDISFVEAAESDANYVAVQCQHAEGVVDHLRRRGFQVKRLSSLCGWPASWPDGFRASACPPFVLEQLLAALREWDAQPTR